MKLPSGLIMHEYERYSYMTGTDLQSLEDKVVQWAMDRNLIEGSTPEAQLSKTLEECGELLAAMSAINNLEPFDGDTSVFEKSAALVDEVTDAYGDILVTLIIGMRMFDLDMKTCLEQAYSDIKDRKGKMVNGVFVKDA